MLTAYAEALRAERSGWGDDYSEPRGLSCIIIKPVLLCVCDKVPLVCELWLMVLPFGAKYVLTSNFIIIMFLNVPFL